MPWLDELQFNPEFPPVLPQLIEGFHHTTRTSRITFALGKLCTNRPGVSSVFRGADDLSRRTAATAQCGSVEKDSIHTKAARDGPALGRPRET